MLRESQKSVQEVRTAHVVRSLWQLRATWDLDEDEGAVMSIPGNEGSMAQAWVKVRGGFRVCRVSTFRIQKGSRQME